MFNGYDPYIEGLKPSFFMVLGSKGSYTLMKNSLIEVVPGPTAGPWKTMGAVQILQEEICQNICKKTTGMLQPPAHPRVFSWQMKVIQVVTAPKRVRYPKTQLMANPLKLCWGLHIEIGKIKVLNVSKTGSPKAELVSGETPSSFRWFLSPIWATKKTRPYFPWNTGWLIGILIYWFMKKSLCNWVGLTPLETLDNQFFFHCSFGIIFSSRYPVHGTWLDVIKIAT